MRRFFIVLAFASLCACGAPAADSSSIEISDYWAAPTPGGVEVSGGYLTIANESGQDDSLVGAHSPRAASVEIHEMIMDGAVMRMRHVASLTIPAGESVTLAPGGLHLMFIGVTEPFATGEEIPVTLTFEHAGDMAVTLPVRRGGVSHDAH